MHRVVGWQCSVCRRRVDIESATPWRCPNATATDRHHVLRPTVVGERPAAPAGDHPFVANDAWLAWAAFAASHGMTDDARRALVLELDDAVCAVDDVGFHVTPFERSAALSDELGFDASGGVWVKDETGAVGGSQKSRHLFSILLQLSAAEALGLLDERPRLAISSCGNAALAASTLARAAEWPIDVFVPTWMSDGFGSRLDELGATVHRCERRADDAPGDPAMMRFREAVEAGAVPFTVQGPENAMCLDGGRTLGWELADASVRPDGPGLLDAVFVQVGGGAFATCVGSGMLDSGQQVPLMAVQAAGCAPFERAVQRVLAGGGDDAALTPQPSWASAMVPWDDPHSLADGILDDETYDWLGVFDAMQRSGGAPVIASERSIVDAHELAHRAGYNASPTGSSGLAGLVEVGGATAESLTPSSRVGLVMSGVTR